MGISVSAILLILILYANMKKQTPGPPTLVNVTIGFCALWAISDI